jgi:site-specific recombinase XerD
VIEERRTKEGKRYYFVRVKSGRIQVATRAFDTKRAAEVWEREQKHRIATGKPLPAKRFFTLQDLVGEFLEARKNGNPHTFDTDRDNLAALPSALLRRSLASVQAEDIREHLLSELRRGLKPSTVARARTTLSALFTFADSQGLLHQPHPVRTVRAIPELTAPALRAVSPADVPDPAQLARAIEDVRARRADIADVYEFMSLTGLRWGETRAVRVFWLHEEPFSQLIAYRSHSDRYEEKDPKSWRGTRRAIPLSPRAVAIFRHYAHGKRHDDYLFSNKLGQQLTVSTIRKYPLGFRRHALRHYAASRWLRLGTPAHEVAEYLGDDPRTVLAVYAHILGEGQRRAHLQRLADAEAAESTGGHLGVTWGPHGRSDGIDR